MRVIVKKTNGYWTIDDNWVGTPKWATYFDHANLEDGDTNRFDNTIFENAGNMYILCHNLFKIALKNCFV